MHAGAAGAHFMLLLSNGKEPNYFPATTETYDFPLFSRYLTVPATLANNVWSLPIATFSPA